MQTAPATTTSRKPPPIKLKARPKTSQSSPPIITPEMDLLPTDATRYPVAIFGRLPAGFVLRDQQIQMLVFWHRKAMKAVDSLPAGHTDADMAAAMGITNEILDAIKEFRPKRASEVAAQMQAIVERLDLVQETSIEVELDVAEFKRFTQTLIEATSPLRPKKRIGALQRGRQLTRAGLVHRYHAFLIQELETIGWHFYGERDYPMMARPYDYAVNERCKTPNGRGQHPIFFSPGKLTDRARSVLKSLKIDTERNDEVPARSGKRRP